MDQVALATLAEGLRQTKVFKAKENIRPIAEIFNETARSFGIPNGDDTAFIKDGDGYLLFAAEGIDESLVQANPGLAGRSAVLANVNDIYAMGGKPIALVDVVAAPDDETAVAICQGMRENAVRFNVPIVGGHTIRTSGSTSVGMAILGRADNLITSFDAAPGQHLVLVTNKNGQWLDSFGFWNCTLPSEDDRLVRRLELLKRAADLHLVKAGKDVSMAGIAGTAMMLAETSGVGVTINMDAIAPPEQASMERWLTAFMSYGFVLAVDSDDLIELVDLFLSEGIAAEVIGSFTGERRVLLQSGGQEAELWDFDHATFVGGEV